MAGVITDTPSVMKKLWHMVEEKYPKICALGCWAHILALAMHDIAKKDPINTVRCRLVVFQIGVHSCSISIPFNPYYPANVLRCRHVPSFHGRCWLRQRTP